jgi:fermentation-respiration switch protein FrsA (DUF1100 family)
MVTFQPSKATSSWTIASGVEEVWFTTRDGVRLNGWYRRSPADCNAGTVIYFHGNAGNIANVDWIAEALVEDGFNVLLFDYRGYGRSSGKLENEQELYKDADAAYDFAYRRGAQASSLFLYGQSLGTTAAADLAWRRPCAGLVLESGFSSASHMASSMLPWLPRWLHFVGRNRFESGEKLARVHCPVLVVHGDGDKTIPIDEGHNLFDGANEPKRFVVVAGADHNVAGFAGRHYIDEVADFMISALDRPTAGTRLKSHLN